MIEKYPKKYEKKARPKLPKLNITTIVPTDQTCIFLTNGKP